MQAIIKDSPKEGLTIQNILIPIPKSGEVLIRVHAAALCGTDIHIHDWSLWAQNNNLNLPLTIGHECSGEIVELGDNVKGLHIGERVAVETHIPCGCCLQCQIGEQHICANLKIFGVHIDGCFAQYAVVPAICVRKIPDEVSFEVASILEPLGTAFRVAYESNVTGKSVVVIGCGPIGLLAIASASMMGAEKVIGLDISSFRLNGAKNIGADYVFNSMNQDVTSAILDLTNGYGVDVIIEASGNAQAIKQSFSYLRKGGSVKLIGLPEKYIELELGKDVVFKEAQIAGIHGRRMFETWNVMEKSLACGKLNVTSVLSHKLPLSDYAKAIELAKSGQANKILLIP